MSFNTSALVTLRTLYHEYAITCVHMSICEIQLNKTCNVNLADVGNMPYLILLLLEFYFSTLRFL